MKSTIQNSARVLMLLLAALISVNAQAVMPAHAAGSGAPHLNLTITIPDAWQSQIVRQDYENESVFSLKDGNSPAFLFSVTKVSYDQWEQVKSQLKNYTIIENKDGFITFVQKTDVKKIKGDANSQYQQVMSQLDGIVATIRVN